METLDMNQMEQMEGGGCVNCGGAIIMGATMGSWFGGWGALVGAGAVALGPNCLDLMGTGRCSS